MKAYFLPLGAQADRGLPAVLAAMSCGAAKQPSSVSMLRISASFPGELVDRLLEDLRFCSRFFSGMEEFAFFRTDWTSSLWIPDLPSREALVKGDESRLLLQALRGDGVPFSFRTDPEAAEWSLSALLESVPEDFSTLSDEKLAPFVSLLSAIRADLDAGEDVRIMLLCDLTEGYAAGLALGLVRFLRARFTEHAPFIGLIGQMRCGAGSAEEGAGLLRDALSALSGRNLVRASAERETAGADAFWLLGLPASLRNPDSCALLDWASARILGEAWTSPSRPTAGLHTRELPGILTLRTLDQEAPAAAAFLRGAFWCLSDLFPSLDSYFDHPALLRSLAPASRGGLFRRLFRASEDGASRPAELAVLERAFRALALQILSLLRAVPPMLRESEAASALWQDAVRVCGRAVTLASEYDVRRKEADDSGIGKVQPVHRVSLSDTEEEELLRRLDVMSADLGAALAKRAGVFRKTGGHFARAALEDCLTRCHVAEVSAREKLVLMPSGGPEERYALGMQERRVRLLKAAVARCEQDLEEAKGWTALAASGSFHASGPFVGEILDPALAEQAFLLLTGEGEAAEAAAKAVRDGISGLLKGYSLNDAKMLLRNLQSVCRQPESASPMRSLMAGVFSVCGVEVSGLRFQSTGQVPGVPLLPDLAEEGRFFSVASAPDRILSPAREDQTARKRGLLALMLLREYRRRGAGEAALEVIPLHGESSALTRVYLSSRGVEEAFLCGLRGPEEDGARFQPLAVLLPGLGPEPARLQASGASLVPSFCFWLDREALTFRDPCVYFSEGDRQILTEQLTRLRAALNPQDAHVFSDFLQDWHLDIMQVPRQDEDPDALRRRLRIVCGLHRLPVWQKDLQRIPAFYEASLPEDPVCAALSGRPGLEAAACRIREDVIYAFRGVPVARENARRLLVATRAPEEAHYLASLGTECSILLHSSDDYHEVLAAGAEDLLRRFPEADPSAVQAAKDILAEAREPIKDQVTELAWPWDTVSASVLTILTESLGSELAPAALHAFSDRLALFPARGGEILGDVLLSSLCLLRREIPAAESEDGAEEDSGESRKPAEARPDAVLPPLSPDFARAVCRSARGQSLLRPGFLSLEAEESSIRAVLTLEGAFTLKLVRVYAPEEISVFYAHDLPTLALWPSLPFAPEDWRAYYAYAHCAPEFGFTAVTAGGEVPLSGAAPRSTACLEEFPLCFLVSHKDSSLGAVPNLLPVPDLPAGGRWTACVDFGASAASVVFTDGDSRWPMQGPVAVRTLLRSPAASEDLLWREFLPAVPVSALIPCALRVFGEKLPGDCVPFRDGAVFMSSSLRDVLDVSSEALYTDLKWNAEQEPVLRLCLHQLMLLTALQARCGGARELNWRFALPDEMAAEGRERLAETVKALSETVSRESGLPFTEKKPPVVFLPESAALGAYVRFCCPDQSRGGFISLDLGADTADLSLFLQGRPDAVRSCQLPLGVHNMLLPALLRRPELLREDFGFVDHEVFQRDLGDMQALLEKARRDPSALRQARYGLDAILADHFPVFTEALAVRRAAGSPGYTGALFLLYESYLMMLAGLMLLQISGDHARNDYLPDTMILFLAGRGNALAEALSVQTKASLWRILTMFRNDRVRSLSLLFSSEKKLEIPVGLSVSEQGTAAVPRPAAAPAAVAVRPEELLPEFLLRFRLEFPEEAALLFPGVYTTDYYNPFTPYGRELTSQALQAAFERRETGKPFPALVSCLNHLMEFIREGVPQ